MADFAVEFRISQRAPKKVKLFDLSTFITQTDGREELYAPLQVLGGFEQETNVLVYTQPNSWMASVTAYKDTSQVYRPTIIKMLPESFSIHDVNEDLSQFLQVVAISMDEFYSFIEDFTDIFDPDRCPAKYLTYLARLINYPLNTRGFDSPVPAVQEASILRARNQLRQAVEVYKRKGLKEAFQILFYSLGYYIELVELWTKNYITFHEAVPANETLYNAEKNPNGWYKSPYFGIKLISINQQTLTTGPSDGSGQAWHFNTDDHQEVLDALHSIRPVHTVLHWIEYFMDLSDRFNEWDTFSFGGNINWEPTEKFFTLCEPDDPQYYRMDERLLGRVDDWNTQGYDPDNYVSRNGPDALLANMVRDPQLGFCDPDLSLEAELGEINWIPDPYCSPVMRDAGLLYRDGYNTNPRDGSVPTRDPSAFEGRNGGYWRNTPLAPFDPDSPNDRVFDRTGCYTPNTSSFHALYQLAEEFEDGDTMYYNQHEFKRWLDSLVAGVGPDPDLTGQDVGHPPAAAIGNVAVAPRASKGAPMVDAGSSLYSVFGVTDTEGYSRSLTRFNFVSGLLASTTLINPVTSLTGGYASGGVGYLNGKIHYVFGLKNGDVLSHDHLVYDTVANTLVRQTDLTGSTGERSMPAYAQVGSKLYLFGGKKGAANLTDYVVFDMLTASVSVLPLPFVSSGLDACVPVNEFIYIFVASTGELLRFNTIDGSFISLERAPMTPDQPRIAHRNNKLMIFAEAWSDGNFSSKTYLEYDFTQAYWTLRPLAVTATFPFVKAFLPKGGRFYGTGVRFELEPSSVVQAIDFTR